MTPHRRTHAALDGLRNTLLAACGLGVGACTSVPAELPLPDQSRPPAQSDDAKRPKPKPEPEPEPEAVAMPACIDPSPVMIEGVDSGYVRCADGAINRVRERRCTNSITALACSGPGQPGDCTTHADCTAKPHGFCMKDSGMIGPYCACVYPCIDDSECGAQEACLCPEIADHGPSFAVCAPARCMAGTDCPSGECGASYHFDGCGFELSLQCRSEADACRSQADCGDRGGSCSALSVRDRPAATFGCETLSCVVGRPLTVDAGVRVAELAPRAWGSTTIASLVESRSEARARYWLEIARMEHASVASFARFVLELTGFGAPPAIVRDALAAAADEVGHAEQTFALASAYAGAAIGPGALQVRGLAPTRSLEQFVTRLIAEGCVGETVGVAEALALLDHADALDPALRPRLEQIAADETRHAALAWRTLRWIADRVDPAVIERAFDDAIAGLVHGPLGCADEPADLAHGLLGSASKRRIRARALARVVEPCRRAMARA